VLRIELKLDGSLQDVYVLRNSGAAFLDDVALQAVREAQPFPNPPRGIADDDGIIRITYRFTLDIESGGFKLF
jgi:protein TonB